MTSWIIKTIVWVAPQIIQAQSLIIHDIMRKPNSSIFLLHIFQTICKRWYFSLSLQKFEKTTWERGLETRQTLNSTRSSLPTSFKSEGDALTDPMEIADRFCKYFTNIVPNLARSIPCVNPSFRSNLGDNNHPSSDLKPTTTTELESICCKFSLKQAPGYDSIPMHVINYSFHVISTALSISPCKLKTAKNYYHLQSRGPYLFYKLYAYFLVV